MVINILIQTEPVPKSFGGGLVWISLCNLCVLGVSLVNEFVEENHHRDTEDTEVAQRRTQIRPLLEFSATGSCPHVAATVGYNQDVAFKQISTLIAGVCNCLNE